MAFAASGHSGTFRTLVEFLLDATTLRYSDDGVSIQLGKVTGAYYDGRLATSGMLVRDLGTFLEAKETISTFDVVLDNQDRAIADLIQKYTFANRQVRIWLGEGDVKSNFNEVFRGTVAFPNGIRWDEDAATFTVVDQRVRDRRTLPSADKKYDDTTYTNIEPKSKNLPIPIIYGNWSSAQANGLSVPCACINTSTLKFKFARHGIKSIDRYLKNAARISPSNIASLSLSDASFTLSGVTYNYTDDIVSVNCQGIKTINGSLIETPADTLRHLLTGYCALTADNLEVSAINAMNIATSTDVVRRWIGNRDGESTEKLISELMSESQSDLRFVRGKYSPKYRSPDIASSRTTFNEADIIIEERSEKAEFSVEMDPQRFYANKINARYRFDPINIRYDGSFVTSSPAAIANASATVERLFDFNWFYDTTLTQYRVLRELITLSTEPVNIVALLSNRGMLINLADQIDLTYNVFDSQTVQIRRVETNLAEMTTRVSGFNLFLTGVGRWTADSAPKWTDSSLVDKSSQGYWMNVSGYASSVQTSDAYMVSRWY